MVDEVRNQPLGRLLIRLLDGEVDFVFISSMAAVLINLGWQVFTYEGTERRTVPQCAELVESSSRFRWSAFTGN
jgi:hypothetical protein